MKKKPAKGHSLFWRKDRRRWCLTFAGKAGWSEPITKFAPADMGKHDKKRATRWADLFLQNAEQLDLFPRARPNGIALRVRVETWKKIRASDPASSPATLAGYHDLFKNVIMRPFKDGRDFTNLGDEDVVSLGTDFSLLRKWMRAMRKEFSASRARGAFFTLRVFFDDAIVERWFRGANPLLNAALVRELPALPTAKERGGVVHLSFPQVQKLLDSPRVPLRRRVRYAVTTTTAGQRDGEISGLTWSRLELDDPELSRVEIAQARRLIRAKDEVLGKTKTSSSNRIAPAHSAARAALLEWRDDPIDGVATYLGRAPLPSDPVFPSARARDRGAFARPASAELLRVDLAAVGLPTQVRGKNVDFHALRKTFATALYELDVDELTRKRLLGHGSNDVTAESYTGEAFAKMKKAVELLPLAWTPGVRFEPSRAPWTPSTDARTVRPGTLTERILAFARAHAAASSGTIARALGAKVGTTATTLSELRASGLLPPALPRVVSPGRAVARNVSRTLEPPSGLEPETCGLRNGSADSSPRAQSARRDTKRASTSVQANGPDQVNGVVEELESEDGRETAPPHQNHGQKTGAPTPVHGPRSQAVERGPRKAVDRGVGPALDSKECQPRGRRGRR